MKKQWLIITSCGPGAESVVMYWHEDEGWQEDPARATHFTSWEKHAMGTIGGGEWMREESEMRRLIRKVFEAAVVRFENYVNKIAVKAR